MGLATLTGVEVGKRSIYPFAPFADIALRFRMLTFYMDTVGRTGGGPVILWV